MYMCVSVLINSQCVNKQLGNSENWFLYQNDCHIATTSPILLNKIILTCLKTRAVYFFLIMASTKLRYYFVAIFQILIQLLGDIRAIHLLCFFFLPIFLPRFFSFVYFLSSGKSIRLCSSLTLKSVCILYK